MCCCGPCWRGYVQLCSWQGTLVRPLHINNTETASQRTTRPLFGLFIIALHRIDKARLAGQGTLSVTQYQTENRTDRGPRNMVESCVPTSDCSDCSDCRDNQTELQSLSECCAELTGTGQE